MADRDDKRADQPLGRNEGKTPYINERNGARVPHDDPGRDAAGTPVAEGAPIRDRPVEAGEVMHGQRHEAALAGAAAHRPRDDAHYADHSASPPGGSNRIAVETPKDGKSRKLLIGAVALVVVILALMFFIPEAAEARALLAAVIP
jgi:hypothetical protein